MTNKKTTKRALLSSVLSLVICLTMLIGTTFAWFTDSVTSTGNKIQAGTLKIDLLVKDDAGKYQSIKDSKAAIFNYDLWEPGYTEYVNVKVANTGTLALKFMLKIVSKTAVSKLADVIDVYFIDGDVTPTRESLATMTPVGTLSEVTQATKSDDYLVGELLADDKVEGSGLDETYATIALKMQESAGNDYQGLTFGEFDINLMATQLMSESDSFDNTYDKGATYLPAWDGSTGEVPEEENGVITITTAGEVAAFAKSVNEGTSYSGKKVVLGADIDLDNKAWTPIGACNSPAYFQGTFDGQGHTIYNLNVDKSTDEYMYSTAGFFGWIDAATATIKNVNFDGATVRGSHWVGVVAGYMTGHIENCNVTNANVFGYNVNGDANGDKVGGVVGYMNSGAGKLDGNTVSDSVICGYRDVAGLAGAVATSNTVTGNAVKDVYVLYSAEHVGEIVSPKTAVSVDKTNIATNVNVVKATTDGVYSTDENTYYIADEKGLNWVAEEVNKYSNYERPFSDKTIKLLSDIDLGGKEWTPIGDYRFSANRFCGTFDGQGHTVSNFKITKKTDKNDSNKSSYGFFGNMEGTVKNLTIDNANLCTYAYVGALVGRLSNGEVINCHVKNSSVESTYWQAGGMIGQLNENSKVSGCTITNSTVTGASAIGGLVGPITATGADKNLLFENCVVADCAVIQKGSFGGSYDSLFGAMFADVDVADNETNINKCTVENTTVKGVESSTLYNTLTGSKVYIDGVKVGQ